MRSFQMQAVLFCLGMIAFFIVKILQTTGGFFSFTLDDPYIHLALAENLRHGHYGINLGETSSASSSILYPFLLAAFGASPMSALGLNIIGALGSAWILAGLVWRSFAANMTRGQPILTATMAFLIAGVNGYTLTFTGMEHTLHVCASLLILRGLTRLSRETGPDGWMIAGMIAAPLLRFEGAALTLAAIMAVAVWGHWRKALFVTLTLALAGALYAIWMVHLNLPILPSSVLVKSKVAAAAIDQNVGGTLSGRTHHILTVLQTNTPARWLVVGMVFLYFAFLPPRNGQRITVALVVSFAAYAHLMAGLWGWYGRYEIYIIATMVGAVVFVWSPILSVPKWQQLKQLVAFGVAILMSFLYVTPLITSHMASNNIFGQQHQMHRFATEFFPHSVAVNDLGWVAYRNDNYVLDLWGLGSETARQNRKLHGIEPDWIAQLAQKYDVKFAMVYPGLFKDKLPQDWCLMATIKTPRIFAASDYVGFFLIDPTLKGDMQAALQAFSETLPVNTSLHAFDCETTPYDWTVWAN